MLTFALDKKPSLRRLSWGATLAKHYHTVSTGEHNLVRTSIVEVGALGAANTWSHHLRLMITGACMGDALSDFSDVEDSSTRINGGCWVRWIHTVNTATSVSNGFLLPSGPTLSWSFVLKHIRLPFVG